MVIRGFDTDVVAGRVLLGVPTSAYTVGSAVLNPGLLGCDYIRRPVRLVSVLSEGRHGDMSYSNCDRAAIATVLLGC